MIAFVLFRIMVRFALRWFAYLIFSPFEKLTRYLLGVDDYNGKMTLKFF